MKKILSYLFIIAISLSGVYAATMTKQMTNFNTGELSPLMKSRSDFNRYDSGAQTLQNMVINPQGPISRRPGTQYIATVKDSNDETRLFPYEDSIDNSYIIEAGDDYFRFYCTTSGTSGQIVDVNDDPYEVVSPYDCNDIFEVQFAQDSQYMRFVHPDYPPYKLSRTTNTSWTMAEIDFENGPFLAENDDTTSTITPSATNTNSYDSYVIGDASANYYYIIRGVTWMAQSFTASSSYDISGVKLRLFRVGSPGLITVTLKAADEDGKPTGSALATGTEDCNDIQGEVPGEWVQIDFSADYTLVADTQYTIECKALSGDVSNSLQWRLDRTGEYSGGDEMYSSNSGSTWYISNGDSTDYDCMFQTIAANDANEATITLEASEDIFDDDHVGALWEISHIVESSGVTGYIDDVSTYPSGPLLVQEGRMYDFITTGQWTGTVKLQRSYDDGSSWEDVYVTQSSSGSGNIQFTGREDYEDADYRVYLLQNDSISRGTLYYTLTARTFVNHGIVTIATVTDANTATAYVETDIASTNATYRWAEGAWSTYRGFPRTIEMHEQRMIYGGSASYPQTVWSSVIRTEDADYDDFTSGVNDDRAWVYVLPGNNPIQWMRSMTYLMIGTADGVGRLGTPDKPLTPTFVEYKHQAKNGSAYQQALKADNYILYLERNAKKVRELSYSMNNDGFLTPDLTILAEHITGDGIVQMDFQSRPFQTLYCVRDDGEMAVLTYEKSNEVVGWSRYVTGE